MIKFPGLVSHLVSHKLYSRACFVLIGCGSNVVLCGLVNNWWHQIICPYYSGLLHWQCLRHAIIMVTVMISSETLFVTHLHLGTRIREGMSKARKFIFCQKITAFYGLHSQQSYKQDKCVYHAVRNSFTTTGFVNKTFLRYPIKTQGRWWFLHDIISLAQTPRTRNPMYNTLAFPQH